ncbi:MAG: helix-turn-helix domain-containing protein, partial [Bacteroidota bacterium]
LKEAKGYCLVFDHSFLDRRYILPQSQKLNRLFNYHIETPIIQAWEMGQDSLQGIAWKLHDEYHFPNDFAKSEMLHTLLHVLLLKAERVKEFQSISGLKTDWLERFNQFKSLLESNYVTTRSSRDYAIEMFISYKFLNEIVKKLSGKTVKAFIDDFVAVEIKRYLVSTSLSVKEISYQTGFEEPANMIKFFKKNTGFTPRRFREQK